MSAYQIEPIAYINSPYSTKFGISRQPGLVPAANITIKFLAQFNLDSVRGLDEFDYIWVQFIFHDALAEGWSELVRPPRLGGKTKKGVFATRSPHRPNHIGLSLLKLEKIEYLNKQIILHCSGADLLDKTPVIDIKPYIPFVEAKPDAHGGFALTPPVQLNIVWDDKAQALASKNNLVPLIEQSIAQDPRPAYQDIPDRIYYMQLAGFNVSFQINAQEARIIAVNKE